MQWKHYPGYEDDITEGAVPQVEGRPKGKKRQKGQQAGPPQPAKGPSGKERVQHKLAKTTAPIPYQEVDWPTRSQYLKRLTQLRIEKTTWVPHWEDLSWHILPRQSRFMVTDRNMGYRKDRHIINSRATKDVETAAAGMMSGISSPSRPWFKLGTRNPDVAKSSRVKSWLDQVSDRLRLCMAKSNFYTSLHMMYRHLLVFGTSLAVIEEDFDDGIRLFVQPIGAYALAQGGDCRVNTAYREMSLTCGQLVEKFGLENCSNWVQWNWRKGNYDFWTYVTHVIEPNRKIDNVRWEARFKKIRSAWFELGAYSGSYGYDTSDAGYSGEPLNFLMESGYDETPFVAPRWQTTGVEDIYGESPAMTCLGDIRELQATERAESKLIAKLVDPPMKGPASLRMARPNLLPGGFTAVDDAGAQAKVEPIQIVDPRGLQATGERKKQILERIDAGFAIDVWQMFAGASDSSPDPQKTAFEVAALKEEKLQVLGPMLDRLHNELLGPAIHRIVNILARAGQLPMAPPEMRGQELDIEYVSTAAQAQRAIGVQAMQSTISFTQSLVELGIQDALDNIDGDASIEDFAEKVGVNPALLRDKDKVAALRQQRAQQQQQAAQAAQAEQLSKTAKNLGTANTSPDNGLGQLLAGIGQGVGQPGGQMAA